MVKEMLIDAPVVPACIDLDVDGGTKPRRATIGAVERARAPSAYKSTPIRAHRHADHEVAMGSNPRGRVAWQTSLACIMVGCVECACVIAYWMKHVAGMCRLTLATYCSRTHGARRQCR